MKKKFVGYYRPSEKEFSELWKSCLFAFDTNVLLNLYRYTPATKASLLGILEKVSERIWLPYQAAYEYHNRRVDVIQQQMKAYDAVVEIVRKSIDEARGKLGTFARHPSIKIDEILKPFDEAFEKSEEALAKLKGQHPDLLIDDPINETLAGLFDGKVGEPTPEDELEQIYKQGERRYRLGIPPGYADRNKGDASQYGDLVMWFQVIAKAKEDKRSVIFVTDDRKEDWWLRPGGKTIGPRPELVQEISKKAAIKFYMYSADPFMQYARKYLKQRVEKKAIDEVREVRQRDEKSMVVSKETVQKLISEVLKMSASDAVQKSIENAEKGRASLLSNPGLESVLKMAEYDRARKESMARLLDSSNWDVLSRIAENAEKVRASLLSNRGLESTNKVDLTDDTAKNSDAIKNEVSSAIQPTDNRMKKTHSTERKAEGADGAELEGPNQPNETDRDRE
jgi:hypothetical protein